MSTYENGDIKAIRYRLHHFRAATPYEMVRRQVLEQWSMKPGFLIGHVRPIEATVCPGFMAEVYMDADLVKEHPSGQEAGVRPIELVRDPEYSSVILAGDWALEEAKQKAKESEGSALLEARERKELERLKRKYEHHPLLPRG